MEHVIGFWLSQNQGGSNVGDSSHVDRSKHEWKVGHRLFTSFERNERISLGSGCKGASAIHILKVKLQREMAMSRLYLAASECVLALKSAVLLSKHLVDALLAFPSCRLEEDK